jgi:hypothetical protein
MFNAATEVRQVWRRALVKGLERFDFMMTVAVVFWELE